MIGGSDDDQYIVESMVGCGMSINTLDTCIDGGKCWIAWAMT
jgi:hypothetical protein